VAAPARLRPVRRSVTVLVVLLAVLWQSVSLARAGLTVDALGDLKHAMLHWHGTAHHHHGDGSFHLDDSRESLEHVVTDLLGVPLLATTVPTQHGVLSMASVAPGPRSEPPVPQRPPDGLLRPPRPRP
jgi:hypothetical protein